MNNDNFFSVDRLVEFGLGIAVAQQMTKSMNHVLENAHLSGSMNPIGAARVSTSCFIILDGKQAGPFSEEEMARLIAEGKLTKATYVWKPGMPNWDLAENVAEILKIVALSPPPFKPEG